MPGREDVGLEGCQERARSKGTIVAAGLLSRKEAHRARSEHRRRLPTATPNVGASGPDRDRIRGGRLDRLQGEVPNFPRILLPCLEPEEPMPPPMLRQTPEGRERRAERGLRAQSPPPDTEENAACSATALVLEEALFPGRTGHRPAPRHWHATREAGYARNCLDDGALRQGWFRTGAGESAPFFARKIFPATFPILAQKDRRRIL